jgi:hypothetical protein
MFGCRSVGDPAQARALAVPQAADRWRCSACICSQQQYSALAPILLYLVDRQRCLRLPWTLH